MTRKETTMTNPRPPDDLEAFACGVCGHRIRPSDWPHLELVGTMPGPEDHLGLELRNCPCGATYSRELLVPPNEIRHFRSEEPVRYRERFVLETEACWHSDHGIFPTAAEALDAIVEVAATGRETDGRQRIVYVKWSTKTANGRAEVEELTRPKG